MQVRARLRLSAVCLLLMFAAATAIAQPVVDGTVNPGEYTWTSGEWSMASDETYLYVGKTNVPGLRVVIHLDVDPRSTPEAGEGGNGNLAAPVESLPAVTGTYTTNLPFRGDARVLTSATGSELLLRDGSNGWTAGNHNDVTTASSGNTVEFSIPWASLPGLSARPAAFHWLGFELATTNSELSMAKPIPAANTAGAARLPYFHAVADAANGSPFAVRQSSWRVTSNGDSGADTFRQAIDNANADVDSSRRFITFDLATTAIAVSSGLPHISRTTTIDGTTQSGWIFNPRVSVAGNSGLDGLWIEASDVTLRGLILRNFNRSILVTTGFANALIAGNWIGLNDDGSAAPNTIGIKVGAATNTTIGGGEADRNVISGNTHSGINIENATGTIVFGNYVGTNPGGTSAIPNGTGIVIYQATGTSVGGSVISGNSGDGINSFGGSDLTILGTTIGEGADGSALGNGGDGIDVDGGATIGTPLGPNLIANNARGIAATVGDLVIRGNPLYDNGITVANGQPAPVVHFATLGGSSLRLQFSLTSNSTTAPTQSFRVDLYASVTDAKTFRAASPCYAGSSLSNVVWLPGSGYSVVDNLVLMVTSYEDPNCLSPGDGTSQPTAIFNATAAASSTTTLGASATTVTVGTNVTLTATIGSSNNTNIAGTVAFMDGDTAIAGCGAAPVSGGAAQCITSFPATGSRSITATYSGDGARLGSTSNTVAITVEKAATTLTLASDSPADTTLYTPVTITYTATVGSATGGITGTVTFANNGTAIAGCTDVPVVSNQAQCVRTHDFTTGSANVGITADYSGDGTHFASSGTQINNSIKVHTFNGPGNFSTAAKWTGSAPPTAGKNVLLNGACVFDSGAADLTYGAMQLALNASVSWPSNHARALAVSNVTGLGANVINMTNGGSLNLSGTFDASNVALVAGTGTVVLSGTDQVMPALTYNHVLAHDVASLTGTATVKTFFVAAGGTASLRPGTLIVRNSIGAATPGSLLVANVTVPAGETVTWSTNITSGGGGTVLYVDGTLVPADPALVYSGGSLAGTGTVKVTSTATNGFSSQYAMTAEGNTLTVEFAGSAAQSIDSGDYYNLTLNNAAGATTAVNHTLTVNNVLTLTAGVLTPASQFIVAQPAAIIATGGWIVTPGARLLLRVYPGTNHLVAPTGLPTVKTPMTLDLRDVASQFDLALSVSPDTGSESFFTSSGVDIDRDVNLVWRVDLFSAVLSSWDVTLDFSGAGLLDAAATPSTFVLRRRNNLAQFADLPLTRTATTVTGTNLPSSFFVFFMTGNQKIDSYAVTASSPRAAGTPFLTTVTARDKLSLPVAAGHAPVNVTMSGTGSVQFDADGNGTFGDAVKALTAGSFTISTRDNVTESVTITATDTNTKTGNSGALAIGAAATTTTLASSANPSTGGQSVTFTATVTSPGSGTITGTVTFRNGSTVIGAASVSGGSAALTTSALEIGTHSITATYEGAATFTSSVSSTLSQVVNAGPFGTPAGLTATATSATQVSVSWFPVSGATSYEVFRATVHGSYSAIGTTAATGLTDNVSASTTYLYAVRAIGAGVSALSAPDAATTVVFTDVPLTAGIAIKAVHLTELRTAVNAMRIAAGLGTATFTDASLAGVGMKAVHITELRTALDAARAAIGLSAISYTDPSLTAGVTARTAHVTDLRNGTQ
jgi:Bacterial Ig-like domain (group 3)/Right handed beta helix region